MVWTRVSMKSTSPRGKYWNQWRAATLTTWMLGWAWTWSGDHSSKLTMLAAIKMYDLSTTPCHSVTHKIQFFQYFIVISVRYIICDLFKVSFVLALAVLTEGPHTETYWSTTTKFNNTLVHYCCSYPWITYFHCITGGVLWNVVAFEYLMLPIVMEFG